MAAVDVSDAREIMRRRVFLKLSAYLDRVSTNSEQYSAVQKLRGDAAFLSARLLEKTQALPADFMQRQASRKGLHEAQERLTNQAISVSLCCAWLPVSGLASTAIGATTLPAGRRLFFYFLRMRPDEVRYPSSRHAQASAGTAPRHPMISSHGGNGTLK